MGTLYFTVLVIALSAEGLLLLKQFVRSWRGDQEDVLIMFVLISAFLYTLAPAYYVLLSGRFQVFQFGFPLSTWCFGLLLEVVFYAIFIVILKVKRRTPLVDRLASSLRHMPGSAGFPALLLLLSVCAYGLLWGPWSTRGYEAAGNGIKLGLANQAVTVGGVQDTVLRALILPSVCVLLFYVPKRKLPIWLFPVLWGAFGYLAVKALASGGRGEVLDVVLAVSACFFAAGKRLKPVACVVGVMLFLSVFSSAIVAFRGNARKYAGLPVWDKAQIIFNIFNRREDQGTELSLRDWIERYMRRLDAGQDGGILAVHTAAWHEFAYFRPFEGALLAFVPRYFWPGKPVPLSDTNSFAGLPWFRVMRYRGQPWNNGGVATSGIAYWQFGWLGVVLTAIFGVFMLRFLSALMIRGGPVGLLFFLSFVMMTNCRMPVGIDETIFIFTQVLLPLFCVFSIYRIFVGVIDREARRLAPYVLQRSGAEVVRR